MTSAIKNAIEKVQGKQSYGQDWLPPLKGRVAVVTGASGGIGFETVKSLIQYGEIDKVYALGAPDSVDVARDAMLKSEKSWVNEAEVTGLDDPAKASNSLEWIKCDFQDMKETLQCAKELTTRVEEGGRLDFLLLNAGMGINTFILTKDGVERHLQVNSLSHVLLANHLLPIMRKTAKRTDLADSSVRIITMASELHRPAQFGSDWAFEKEEFKKDVGPFQLYNRTKLAQILLAKGLLSHALTGTSKIRVFSVHPGGVATGQIEQWKEAYGTPGEIGEKIMRPIMRDPPKGSLSLLWAACAPDAAKYENGTYFTDPNQKGEETKQASNTKLIDNFWNNSQAIIREAVGDEAFIDWQKED
ncbi:NAD(P)-binding protein [Atractiella rhizophila]|nr:NAD(P)-binding protein [Atractiella rhizophila]